MNDGECPFCGVVAQIIQNNGNWRCLMCGPWHNCQNGPVRGDMGPLHCPKCNPLKIGTICPFCQRFSKKISTVDASPYCGKCGFWHECTTGPHLGSLRLCIQRFLSKTIYNGLFPDYLSKIIYCSGCQKIIVEQIFKCQQCSNFNYCNKCIRTCQHDNTHNFVNL